MILCDSDLKFTVIDDRHTNCDLNIIENLRVLSQKVKDTDEQLLFHLSMEIFLPNDQNELPLISLMIEIEVNIFLQYQYHVLNYSMFNVGFD